MKKLLFVIGLLQIMFTSRAQTTALDTTDNYCIGAYQWIYQFEDWSKPRICDFDNDGDKDFVILERSYDSLAVYINNGTADFTVTPAYKISTTTYGNLVELAVSDFDADGFIDVVTIADNGDLYFFQNVSGTSLSYVANLSNTILPNLAAQKIEVHDLNNDGLVDIIGSGEDYALGTFYAFTFQQSVTFSFFQMTPIPLFAGHNAQINLPQTHFAISDFDADGYVDFVIGSEDLTDTLEIYTNGGTTASISFLPSPATYTIPTTGFPYYIIARDCNGDGMPDISVSSSNGFSINKNLTAMTFTSMIVDASIMCQQFDFADLNSDSNNDLITSNYGNYNIYRGTSSSSVNFSYPPNNFNMFDRRQFGLANFDGNSTTDILFVGTGDAPFLQVSRNFSFHIDNIITSTNTLICGSTPVQFSVTSTEPSYPGNYNWSPPPGTGTTYTATTAGGVSCAFTFTLPPGLGNQCVLNTDTIYVNSQVPATAVINSSASALTCAGTSVGLNASVSPTATTYTWSTGATTSSITVTPSVTTTYSLFMDDGCQSTGTFTVDIAPKPVVNITAPSTTLCAGDSLVLTANGAGIYTWTPSGANSTTFTVKPTTTSGYTLVGGNSFGCYDTTSTTITVNTPPAVNITASKSLICYPDTVTLTASGAPSYTWSTGSNSTSIPIIALTNTTYSVVGDNGCKATSVFTLSGFPRPNVTVTSSKLAVCNGDSITLKAYGAASYSWAPVLFIGNSFYTYPTANTTYSVLGQSANGCYNYATVSVTMNTPPVLDILASELCIGKSAIFTAVGANTYTWNTGSISQSISQTPPNSTPISFTVDGVDASGCRSTVSKTFDISNQCSLIVWNGVTPNGDGLNDFFFLENIEQYPGNRVQIFNRWGQLLETVEDYNNTSRKWDGTSTTNFPVPSGTYYYTIDLKNGSALLKGYIELTKKDLN
jgi:gliding motility-associated-like protein